MLMLYTLIYGFILAFFSAIIGALIVKFVVKFFALKKENEELHAKLDCATCELKKILNDDSFKSSSSELFDLIKKVKKTVSFSENNKSV